MNNIDKNRLKHLLQGEVKLLKEQMPFSVIPARYQLDEDSGQFHWTEGEVNVFHLDTNLFHELAVAYYAYQILIDIIDSCLEEETILLIRKARQICPPAKYYNHSIPLTMRINDKAWFLWLANEFMDIPLRQAYSYYAKRDFNYYSITSFRGE